MRNRAHVLLAVTAASIALLSGVPAAAQSTPPISASDQQESKAARKPPPPIAVMQAPVRMQVIPSLAAGTEVPLVLTRDVKVKNARPGDTADFVLSRDLWYRDTLLARSGTPVQVVVQTAETARWLSRGSKLGFDIQNLKLLNGSLIALRGEADYRGGINSVSGAMFSANSPGSNTGAAVGGGAMVVGVFGLLAPGKNQDAKSGSRVDAWVAEDIPLDLDSLRAAQLPRDPAAKTGEVRVLRGIWDRLKRRDLYCNGVPVAQLPANRKYVANLKPVGIVSRLTPRRRRSSSSLFPERSTRSLHFLTLSVSSPRI